MTDDEKTRLSILAAIKMVCDLGGIITEAGLCSNTIRTSLSFVLMSTFTKDVTAVMFEQFLIKNQDTLFETKDLGIELVDRAERTAMTFAKAMRDAKRRLL